MTKEELAHNIKSFCLAHANEAGVMRYSRYFQGEYNGYGLTTKQVQEKSKELINYKSIDLPLLLDAMPLFFESGKYEETSVGLLILNGLHKEFTPQTMQNISRWFSMGITNWAHADTLGMYILPRFLEQNIVTFEDFGSWIQSPYIYQRRCVPVAFIKLLKNRESFLELFTFLEPLMIDSERMVLQAMG